VGSPAEGELAREATMKPSTPKPRGQRQVFEPARGEFIEVPIYWRADLAPGAAVDGPAVIAEDETSTVVSSVFQARIDAFGYIELTRRN
jgi:N-methylhydantoinase A